ncbi:hypothetical protein FO519_007392 [Halicephalobus sp. NKZ332]|nr:hypothetical protein FO519_007392 [Halicephalobus sp. NKZ332]
MSSPNCPDVYKEEYLICGCHIRKFVTVFAIIFMVLGTFSVLTGGFPAVISLIIMGLIIYADKAEEPWAYIPYLVLMGLQIVAMAVGMVVIIVLMIWKDYEMPPELGAILLVALLISLLLCIFCWSLVYRARQYMIREVVSGNTWNNYQKCPESV